MDIIVVGTHEYEWAVRIFAILFAKYWGEPVTYWGDREPASDLGLPFRQVPAYTEGIWTWGLWYSDGLRSILETFEGLVAMFLPDQWLAAPVDKGAVAVLASYMQEHGDVVRGNLTAGSCLDQYGGIVAERGGYEIVQVHPGNPHCSIMGGTAGLAALWNAANFASLLESGWNLWDVEKRGTDKMARLWPRWRSVGIRPAPVRRVHALGQQRRNVVNLEGMPEEDREIARGMLPAGWTWMA